MVPQRNGQQGEDANLVFRVPSALKERFREVAEADHRTVSQELRRLMEMRVSEADSLEQAA